jgi:hypothetical protein
MRQMSNPQNGTASTPDEGMIHAHPAQIIFMEYPTGQLKTSGLSEFLEMPPYPLQRRTAMADPTLLKCSRARR